VWFSWSVTAIDLGRRFRTVKSLDLVLGAGTGHRGSLEEREPHFTFRGARSGKEKSHAANQSVVDSASCPVQSDMRQSNLRGGSSCCSPTAYFTNTLYLLSQLQCQKRRGAIVALVKTALVSAGYFYHRRN
jgi:hypothetical protein